MVRQTSTWQVDFCQRHDDCTRIVPCETRKVLAETSGHAIQQIERKLDCQIDVINIQNLGSMA
jgi:hypothetical protein